MNWALQLAASVAAAAGSFYMALRFYRVWRDPFSIDEGRWVKSGVTMMVAEFLCLHSGVFICDSALHGGNWVKLSAISLGYFLVIALITSVSRSRQVFFSFLVLFISRFISIAFMLDKQQIRWHQAHSVFGAMLYLLLVWASLFFPKLGIKGPRIKALMKGNMTGHWVDNPHCAIGFGTAYFAGLALLELTVLSWFPLK